jgi:hypothetical protein
MKILYRPNLIFGLLFVYPQKSAVNIAFFTVTFFSCFDLFANPRALFEYYNYYSLNLGNYRLF